MGHGVIDLRSRKRQRKPVVGQRTLFTAPTSATARVVRAKPLRVRRRRARLLRLLGGLAFVIVCACVVSYLSYLPRFTVRVVAVRGAQHVSEQQLIDYVQSRLHDGSMHFISSANVVTYPKALIETGIPARFPPIASANLERPTPWSSDLTIVVTERQPFALWCTTLDANQSDLATTTAVSAVGTCFEMDRGGFIFESAPGAALSMSTYRFYGGLDASSTPAQADDAIGSPIGRTFAPGHVPALVAFLESLEGAGYTPIGATIENATDFSIPLTNGPLLKASFDEDVGQLTKNLQLTLDSDALQGKADQLEYVDLRFGDRVYYKFKNNTATSSPAS